MDKGNNRWVAIIVGVISLIILIGVMVGVSNVMKNINQKIEQVMPDDSTGENSTQTPDDGAGDTDAEPAEPSVLPGYTIISNNLITDYTIANDKNLNNNGSLDTDSNYKTLTGGIAVTAGKMYCFFYDGQPVSMTKVVYKSINTVSAGSGNIISYEVNCPYVITIPTGAKYLFCSRHNSYTATWDSGWTKLELYEVTFNSNLVSNLSDYKMLTLGDSLSESGTWQSYVQEMTALKYKNLAVGGTRINVFADNVTANTLADIDVVFIMGLFNSTDSEPGDISDEASNATDASICAGYKYLVEKIKGLKPSVKIILASPHRPRADDVADKAAAVGLVAKQYDLTFIDLYNEAGFNSETYDIYLKDSVHATLAGYYKEAQVIVPYLVETLTGD